MNELLFDISPVQNKANGAAIYTRMVLEEAITRGYQFDCCYIPSTGLDEAILKLLNDNSIPLFKIDSIRQLSEFINNKGYRKVYLGSALNSDCDFNFEVTPIITIHDLRFIEVPNDKTRYLYRRTPFQRLKQLAINLISPGHSGHVQKKEIDRFIAHPKLQVISVSEHTRYSILQTFPQVSPGKIHVFYCPYPKPVMGDEIITDDGLLDDLGVKPGEYFLIISANRWFKNAYRAIQAIDRLFSLNFLQDKKVVVLGLSKGPIINRIKNKHRFVFGDFLPEGKLNSVFKNAFCFIYPSLQEGFGIPPLQAMRFQIPVLVAATSSIPEICGDGAIYFNPYSIQEIQNRTFQIWNDPALYDEMKKRAHHRYQNIAERQLKDLKGLMKFIFEDL
jgi:glycosyltransferase involved in cell wall biosynthesis